MVIAGLAAAVPAQAAPAPAPARPPQLQASRDLGTLATRRIHRPDPTAREARPAGTAWPAAAAATASFALPAPLLPGAAEPLASVLSGSTAGRAMAVGTPVWAARTVGSRLAGVSVHVLGHTAAAAAGVKGVLFTAAAARGTGSVVLGVNYASFANVYGGNYGLGLDLAELPACALTTPAVRACQKERPLPSVNDPAGTSVSATVALAHTVVLAATSQVSDGGGTAGTYAATSLKPSGTWTAGGSSGSFTYSYPIQVPPAASSLVPTVALNYDSSSIDGQTAQTQVQSSWVGDGWSTPQAFIEQSFIPCSDNPEGSASPSSTADECYNGPILTLSLNGTSTPLVCPVPFSYTTTSTCVPSEDDGAVVTHVVNSGNGSGTKFTDYWTVTERDGTTYDFGRNELPGWTAGAGDAATNSVDSVPVFSAHSGDPCFSSSGFSGSSCTMAYRWNMDYATDVHGNAMAYYYKQDTNAYAENGNTSSAVSYVRDSHLDHIDYGFTDGNAYAGPAPDEVLFATGDRCFASSCDPLSSSTAANWMDVPFADNCTAGSSCQVTQPTFWSTVRLASISTQQHTSSGYATVDSWSLTQDFPATGDETSPTLFLESISHEGEDTTDGGAAVTLPSVSFVGEDLPNRLNPGNFPALDRYRIATITTETDEVIEVSYNQVSPCSTTSPPTPSANTSSCFPVFWNQFQPPTPDWFIRYAVQSVDQTDPTGGSPGIFTSYKYAKPAWHFDDNELVEPKFRTYGQFRGYQDAKTFTGTGSDAQTESETTYYQGMSDDNNSTDVTLGDSQGNAHEDANQLTGAPLETTQYNFLNGAVEDSQIFSYWVSPAAATRTRSGLPALTANFTGQVEDWARTAITDGGTTTWRKTETDTSYDATPSDADFGLPQFVFSHGDLSQPSQQTCTSTTYAAANASENLVGLTAETEVDAAACGGSNPNGSSVPTAGETNALTAPAGLSRPDDVISDTRTYYDDPPVLSGGVPVPTDTTWPQAAPTIGDPSVAEKANGYTGGAFTYITNSATAYDSFGRPVASYDANGNETTTSYTMTGGVVTAQQVTNPLGQATTTTFDPLRGLPLTLTDPNGITTTSQYDGLGRIINVWQYNRTAPAKPNFSYSYNVSNSAPTYVTTAVLNDNNTQVDSVTIYDALLRVRQTQASASPGGVVVNDIIYDSRGWLAKQNLNYWDDASGVSPSGSIITVADSQSPDQKVTAFDGLGRPVQVTSYDNSMVRSTAYTAYYGDRVTSVPPAGGTPTSTVTDALGRTTELDQYTAAPTVTSTTTNGITTVAISGGTTQATDYSYNTRGEQSGITYAGQSWSRGYNLLGQVTSTSDPDSGTTDSTFDNNGNLLSSTDANGKTVSYTYDALNRKTGEFAGPNNSSPPIAAWAYDNSDNAVSGMTDPIGQLTTETSYDSSGNAYILQQAGFNAFGESTGETWTIPDGPGGQTALKGTYTLSQSYTANLGLPATTAYPQSPGGALPAETVSDSYRPTINLPNGVASSLGSPANGYTKDTTYDALSQVSETQVGTTTQTSELASIFDSYDSNTSALTSSVAKNSSGTAFDTTSYGYDPSGNITSETDNRGGSTTETQCYTYNTLDQLTQAWTATDNCAANPQSNGGSTVGDGVSGAAYWTSWSFNTLGERSTQTQHSLTGGQNTVTTSTYGSSQPGTLASTSTTGPSGNSSTGYTYDADGNTLTRNVPGGNQTLSWNSTGKLASDTSSSGSVSYLYDADGNVLLQNDSATGQVTLYIFGEQIVATTPAGSNTATVTGTRFIPLPGNLEAVRTGGGSNWLLEKENQQGTGLMTMSTIGQPQAWREFTPYGAPRGSAPPSWPDTNGFLGKPTDPTSGLTIIGARNYDPSTGMFVSIDPLLETASPLQLNGYSYAEDNPVTDSDPTGLLNCDQWGDCMASTSSVSTVHVTSPSLGGPGAQTPPSANSNPGNIPYLPIGTAPTLKPEPQPAVASFGAGFLAGLNFSSLSGANFSNLNGLDFSGTPDLAAGAIAGLHVLAELPSASVLAAIQKFSKLGPLPSRAQILLTWAGIFLGGGPTSEFNVETPAPEVLDCGESFTAGTKVLLATGAAIPISQLRPGDKVLATNVKTGKTSPETVTAVMVKHDTDRYDLAVRSGSRSAIIHTTRNHLFWDVSAKKWRSAAKLRKGDRLKAADGVTVVADGGATAAIRDGWMWDLTVPGSNDHDFYVQAGDASVLVHNCLIFPNKYNDAEILQSELAAAAAAKVAPIAAGTQAFSDAVSRGGSYLWAVGENGELRIVPEVSQAIKHSILFGGGDVQGAGVVDFADGGVRSINDESGHYAPWEGVPVSFLQSGVDAFRGAGVSVPESAITPWEGW